MLAMVHVTTVLVEVACCIPAKACFTTDGVLGCNNVAPLSICFILVYMGLHVSAWVYKLVLEVLGYFFHCPFTSFKTF